MDDLRQQRDLCSFDDRGVAGLRDMEGLSAFAPFGHPTRWHGDLALVVEAEIIPRMMLAYRAESAPEPARSATPTPDEIGAFAELVLAPGSDDVERRIADLMAGGLGLDSLLLDLMQPTARHLGLLWEEDLCDFAEMTIAMGRLQRIIFDLSTRFGTDVAGPRPGRSILLSPCPGETHSFGLTLLQRFFRQAGWEVTCETPLDRRDLAARIRAEWYDVIGLSLGCEVLLPALAATVRDIRQASRNPDVRIMVGGSIFLDNPDHVDQVGADATARDARQAVAIAERLLDLQVRAC